MNIIKNILCFSLTIISVVGYSQKIVGIQTWINDEFDKSIIHDVSENESGFSLDLAERRTGLYAVHMRPVDDTGTYGSVVSSYIYRIDSSFFANRDVKECHIWIDDDSSYTTYPIIDETVDIAHKIDKGITLGLHFIHTRLCYGDRTVTAPVSRVLCVHNDEIPKVRFFRYWWNNNYDEYIEESAVYDPDSNTYVIDSELQIPKNILTDERIVTLNVLYVCEDGRSGDILSSDIKIDDQFAGLQTTMASTAKWNAALDSDQLSITGLTPGYGNVYVYGLSGMLLKIIPVGESYIAVRIPGEEAVIVCYANKSKKVLNQNK